MQLQINISNEEYEKIKKAYTCIFGDIYYIMQGAIANGTPIPEGMSKCRYNLSEDCNNTNCLNCVLDKIRNEFIDRYPHNYANELELGGKSCVFSLNEILQIIDKYKTEESEK